MQLAGALKQELSKSDNDIAKLEDHIRGLLVKSSSTMQKVEIFVDTRTIAHIFVDTRIRRCLKD